MLGPVHPRDYHGPHFLRADRGTSFGPISGFGSADVSDYSWMVYADEDMDPNRHLDSHDWLDLANSDRRRSHGQFRSCAARDAPAATPSTQINAGTPNIFTRLGDKVNSLFGPKVAPEQNVSHGQTAAVVSTMEPPLLETVEQPRGLPFTQPQPGRFESAAIEMVQIQDAPVVSTRQMILDGQVHKVGHNADYSGITGRLEIVNGAYFVHYAAPESGDRFNGRMILTGNLDLNLFRTADLVTIRGVVRPGRTVSLYEAHYVELLERMAP